MESKKVTQAAKRKSPLRIEISESGLVTLSPEMCNLFAGQLVSMRFTMNRNVAQIAFPRNSPEQDTFVMPPDGAILPRHFNSGIIDTTGKFIQTKSHFWY